MLLLMMARANHPVPACRSGPETFTWRCTEYSEDRSVVLAAVPTWEGAMPRWMAAAMLAALATLAKWPPAAAETMPVAAMEQVQHSVYGTPPAGSQEVKHKGDHVVFAEALETSTESRALVRFIDGSGLAMGADSKVQIDRFVFDPDKSAGNSVLKIAVGTLRFVTGAMPKGGTIIKTPVATLTLRGTDVTVHVHANGQTDVTGHEGLVDNHNDFPGQQNTLAPGQSETDTELGNADLHGDLQQYGLNDVTSTTIAEASALINDVETAAGPSDSDSDGAGKGHG